MSIKFKLITKAHDVESDKDLALLNAMELHQLKEAMRSVRGLSGIADVTENLSEHIPTRKRNMKHHQDNMAPKRYIKAVSDLKWVFYPGEYSDEYGVTRYSKEPVVISLAQ